MVWQQTAEQDGQRLLAASQLLLQQGMRPCVQKVSMNVYLGSPLTRCTPFGQPRPSLTITRASMPVQKDERSTHGGTCVETRSLVSTQVQEVCCVRGVCVAQSAEMYGHPKLGWPYMSAKGGV